MCDSLNLAIGANKKSNPLHPNSSTSQHSIRSPLGTITDTLEL